MYFIDCKAFALFCLEGIGLTFSPQGFWGDSHLRVKRALFCSEYMVGMAALSVEIYANGKGKRNRFEACTLVSMVSG